MGIQICIKTAALESKGIEVTFHNEPHTVFCECGCCEGGYCDSCGGRTYDTFLTYAEVEGLPRLMHVMDDVLWSDANHWGSNRAPIMEFINNHLTEEDWYEG